MKKYKAAVVGCGRIGVTMEADPKRIKPATHAGAYHMDPSTELAAIVDPNPSQLENAKKLFPNAAGFSSVEEMLKAVKPDIVSISTPPINHRPSVELCATAGVKAIVCEKPIAENQDDALAIIGACRKSGSLLFINHMRRYDPLLNKIRKEIQDGLIGEISHANAYYTAGLFNTATHLVDLLRFFLGHAEWVTAFPETRYSHPAGDLNLNALVYFEKNVTATLQASEVKNYSIFEVKIFGSKGTMTIDRFGFSVEKMPVRDCVDFAGYKELDVDHRTREGNSRSLMDSMARHVVNCLEQRETVRSRGEDGLAALEILLALKRSSENNGERVDLEKLEVNV